MKKSSQAFLYAALAILFWGTIATAFKVALAAMSINMMLGIASLVSTCVLFLIVLFSGKIRMLCKMTRREILSSALLGLLNPVIYYIILLSAYNRLPGQVAQPVNMIWPIVLVFFSIPLLHQRIPAKSFIALFVSLAGVYIIASQGDPLHPGKSDTTGVLLALISSVLWALYFILNMRDKRDEAIKLLTNFIFGSVYMVILMAVTDTFSEIVTFRGAAAAAYCGIFEMGLTFWLWLKALQLSPTSDRVSNLVYFAPFISLILLHFIIHEPVYYTTVIGLVLIIGSVLFQNRGKAAL